MATIELRNICKSFKLENKAVRLWPPFIKEIRLESDQNGMRSKSKSGPDSCNAIDHLNLIVPDGKTTVILGPSGCGKSTLLRIIAGLLKPEKGEVLYDNVNQKEIPAKYRGIGIVFQDYALYPHYTSKKNIISYYLFKKKTPEIMHIAEEKLKETSRLMEVKIEYLLDKKPSHLSGGERQRVAVGRCITRDPKLFLLDEPFSNLDQILRQKYRRHLKILLKKFTITTVFVTHDQFEAIALADRIAVMREGRIEQAGTFEEIYKRPASVFVAEFLNPDQTVPAINVFPGSVISPQYADKTAGVRAEDITIGTDEKKDHIKAELVSIGPTLLEKDRIAEIEIAGQRICSRIPADKAAALNPGPVWIGFSRLHLFDKETGVRTGTVEQTSN
jgi:multiple sugar transport system ATP-binding protein